MLCGRNSTLFHSNKDSKTIQYDSQLRNLTMGSSTITQYCNKIQTLADLLENLDAEVSEKNLVIYTINGLSSKFNHVASLIRW